MRTAADALLPVGGQVITLYTGVIAAAGERAVVLGTTLRPTQNLDGLAITEMAATFDGATTRGACGRDPRQSGGHRATRRGGHSRAASRR